LTVLCINCEEILMSDVSPQRSPTKIIKIMWHLHFDLWQFLNIARCEYHIFKAYSSMTIHPTWIGLLISPLRDVSISSCCIYCSAIYRHLLSDKKYGLTHNLLATKIMPTLIPLAVCPGLSIDQVSIIYSVLVSILITHKYTHTHKTNTYARTHPRTHAHTPTHTHTHTHIHTPTHTHQHTHTHTHTHARL